MKKSIDGYRAMTLNIIASIGQSGYGYHGLNVVRAATTLGIKVALWPSNGRPVDDENKITMLQAIANQLIYDYNMPSISISPPSNLAFHVGKGARVGWTVFELNKFTKYELHQLSSQDLVLVPSNWAKDIVGRQLPDLPCHVVPEGVDQQIFNSHITLKEFPYGNKTVFINVGKWEKRKAQELLLTAFEKAFDPHDDVILILSCYNQFSQMNNAIWPELCRKSKLATKIIVCNKHYVSQNEIASLMAHADCGVFPSRAEGWNLELLEMMSMGKMVIATNYSAHTEYCSDNNCLLVYVDKLEPACDQQFFFGHGDWASLGDAQEEQLIIHMRTVHKLKQEGYDLINYSGVETARSLSWENSVRQLTDAIKV